MQNVDGNRSICIELLWYHELHQSGTVPIPSVSSGDIRNSGIAHNIIHDLPRPRGLKRASLTVTLEPNGHSKESWGGGSRRNFWVRKTACRQMFLIWEWLLIVMFVVFCLLCLVAVFDVSFMRQEKGSSLCRHRHSAELDLFCCSPSFTPTTEWFASC